MTTRSEMEAKIGRWSKSPDPQSLPLADFFDEAYAMIAREIMPAELDFSETLDVSAGVNVRGNVWEHILPVNIQHVRSVTNNGFRLRTVNHAALQERAKTTGGNAPAWYSIVGGALSGSDASLGRGLVMWVAPGVGGDLRIVYTKRDDYPSTGAQDNHGLVWHEDAYLAAGLVAAFTYMEDDDNQARWMGRYARIRDSVNREAERKRRGGGAGVAA